MSEWRLFDPQDPPYFLSSSYLERLSWMDLRNQPGFGEREQLVLDTIRGEYRVKVFDSLTDLGAGDGSLLADLGFLPDTVRRWGYEIGQGDLEYARRMGRPVSSANIVVQLEDLELGELVVATEFLEHLADPHQFVSRLADKGVQRLVVSSPSKETGDWHNEIHAWAWDKPGYRVLLEDAGYRVVLQNERAGGTNTFRGVTGNQSFQVCVAQLH